MRSIRSAGRRAPTAAAAALLLFAGPALAGDLIQRKDGKFSPNVQGDTPAASDFDSSSWTVTDADIEKVSYTMKLPGAGGRVMSQDLPSSTVMEIWLEPSRYPAGWKEAVDALNQGNYAPAAGAFRGIAETKGVHPVVRQKALLNYARAAAGAGSPAQGKQAYEQAIEAAPKSFYARALLRELSRLLMDAGQLPEALDVIGRLLKLPGVTDADKIEARLLQVTVDYRKAVAEGNRGAIQKAMEEFKGIARDTQNQKDLQGVHFLAKLGQANAMLESGNGKEARLLFEEIAANASETSVLASAHNGLGMTWYQEGGMKGWEEARRSFLKTVVMYGEGASGDDIAKALYHVAECFSRLQDHEEWKTRAQNEARECMRRFPSSPWSEKCRRLLMGLPK